jgi:hypothetical protein
MKPIFPVNLCKLTDKLFTEFSNADYINITGNDYLTIVVRSLGQKLAVIHLNEEVFLTDVAPNTIYDAYNIGDKIKYCVGDKEAVSGLELEKNLKELKEVIRCYYKDEKVLLDIDNKLLETLKVLDNVF